MPTTRVKNHLLTYHIPLIQILNFGIKVFAHVREIAPEKFFKNVLCIRRIVLRKDFASLPIVFSQNKSLILRQKKERFRKFPFEIFFQQLSYWDICRMAFMCRRFTHRILLIHKCYALLTCHTCLDYTYLFSRISIFYNTWV